MRTIGKMEERQPTPASRTRGVFGPLQTPVVPATICKKHLAAKASSALRWGTGCAVGVLLLAADMWLGLFAQYLAVSPLFLWSVEMCIMVILLMTILYDAVFYINTYFFERKIQLTATQKKLLAVPDTAPGYSTVEHARPVSITPSSSSSSPAVNFYTPLGTPYNSVQGTPFSFGSSSRRSSPARQSPYTFEDGRITDQQSLESFLQSEEERDQQALACSPELSSQSPNWFARHSLDIPSPLRKYHIATRSSPSHSDSHSPLCKDMDSWWSKMGIKRDDLDRWTENCRKWLARTILIPVAREIENVNAILSKNSCPEQIGAVELSVLRHIAKSKVQSAPTLGMIMTYLEVSSKQEYVVQRIRELAEGDYISAFRWNAGGSWKGRDWDQDLPNDSQILMHMLCTYLDSHLPPNPRFPDGRPFSSQYFLKCPDKPEKKKADLCIYQSSLNPPNYKVLIKDGCIEVHKGRYNMFHALVAFLHYIKTKEKSMLGQINLELSGLNILWVVSS